LQHITCQLAVGFEMSDFNNSHIINNWDAKNYVPHSLQKCKSGIHTFILTNLTEMTNKMQLFRTIYYSTVRWLLNMFWAILSLIIRSL
jgi:hypothetical protein